MTKFDKKKEKIILLVAPLLFVSIFITGCKNEECPNAKGVEMLSEKQILKIANKTAKALYFPLRSKQVLYDVEKARWQRNAKMIEMHFPGWSKKLEILNGRDYVIILYEPKEVDEIGDVLWLFIDRKTGEVIMHVK